MQTRSLSHQLTA